ncbi:M1 family aminopeptidase [Hymenobacter weizhouensis]|uniref:M1 family aminopeptidase n=1 Tax=Hymenobacter sp. YIM 151500-1 TaxID=2987689 RepID=UPI0022264E4F|nr:M1 family aminopeptidase [Hymenobacter sp. YIM 151500-1]UYZ64222.1 M1 family aminopeptidase [Hymenobacter sp. YIM 151500-1]
MKQLFRRAAGVLVLLAGPVAAQVPAPHLDPADLDGTAAQVCAHTRLRQLEGDAQRPAYASVRHRQQMSRYDVSYYKLDISLENNSRAVEGTVTIKARAGTEGLDSLAFELYPTYTIEAVSVDGRPSPGLRRAGGDVTAALPATAAPGALFTATIRYRGTAPSGGGAAIGNALDTRLVPNYNVNVTWSLSEPYHAYEWWPCKQVLTDKADSTDVWVTTSATNKVGSNGVLVATTPVGEGKVRYEWKSRHPIAYYLVSVAVGPYLEYVNYASPAGGPRIPIVNYVYNQAALNTFRTEIDRTPGFLEYFSEVAGLYPFANEKYGHSMAPMGGGMEHQTMTTQTTFNFTLTAHELMHQWFGNNVTCGAWEDIWLNEGFASYGEYLALHQLSSPAAARQWLDQAHQSAMRAAGGSVRAADTTSVGRIFSSALSYKKGAAVVHMLRYLLQDDAKFFRALRTYQSTYAGRTARTRDLQRVFEQEAGRSLQYFFDQWFRGEGYPTFTVRWNQTGGTVYLQAAETVSMPSVTPFFDTDVDYRLVFTDGSSRTVRLRQSQPVSGFTLPETREVASVQVDPEQWILNNPAGTVVRDASLVLSSRQVARVAPVAVYPNPCREQLRLRDLTGRPAQAEVLDATGRVVLRQAIRATDPVLHTAPLPAGLYLLRLTAPGGEVSQARFVRE